MGYLEQLKTEFSKKASPKELPKLPKEPIDSYDSSYGERFLEIESANEPDSNDPLRKSAQLARAISRKTVAQLGREKPEQEFRVLKRYKSGALPAAICACQRR